MLKKDLPLKGESTNADRVLYNLDNGWTIYKHLETFYYYDPSDAEYYWLSDEELSSLLSSFGLTFCPDRYCN